MDHLHRFGFWLVQGKPCYNKVMSAVEATSKNTKDVQFYFNDHVYNADRKSVV